MSRQVGKFFRSFFFWFTSSLLLSRLSKMLLLSLLNVINDPFKKFVIFSNVKSKPCRLMDIKWELS
jgi:hypothetical protein